MRTKPPYGPKIGPDKKSQNPGFLDQTFRVIIGGPVRRHTSTVKMGPASPTTVLITVSTGSDSSIMQCLRSFLDIISTRDCLYKIIEAGFAISE